MGALQTLADINIYIPLRGLNDPGGLFRKIMNWFILDELGKPIPPERKTLVYYDIYQNLHDFLKLEESDPIKLNLKKLNKYKDTLNCLKSYDFKVDVLFLKLACLSDISFQHVVIAHEYEKRKDNLSKTKTINYFNHALDASKAAIVFYDEYCDELNKLEDTETTRGFKLAGLITIFQSHAIFLSEMIKRNKDFDLVTNKITYCVGILKEMLSFKEQTDKNREITLFTYKSLSKILSRLRYLLLKTVESGDSDLFKKRFAILISIQKDFQYKHALLDLPLSKIFAELALAMDKHGKVETGETLLNQAMQIFDAIKFVPGEDVERDKRETENVLAIAEMAHPLFTRLIPVANDVIEISPYDLPSQPPQEKYRALIIMKLLLISNDVSVAFRDNHKKGGNEVKLRAILSDAYEAYHLASAYSEPAMQMFANSLTYSLRNALDDEEVPGFLNVLAEQAIEYLPIRSNNDLEILRQFKTEPDCSKENLRKALAIIIRVCEKHFALPKKQNSVEKQVQSKKTKKKKPRKKRAANKAAIANNKKTTGQPKTTDESKPTDGTQVSVKVADASKDKSSEQAGITRLSQTAPEVIDESEWTQVSTRLRKKSSNGKAATTSAPSEKPVPQFKNNTPSVQAGEKASSAGLDTAKKAPPAAKKDSDIKNSESALTSSTQVEPNSQHTDSTESGEVQLSPKTDSESASDSYSINGSGSPTSPGSPVFGSSHSAQEHHNATKFIPIPTPDNRLINQTIVGLFNRHQHQQLIIYLFQNHMNFNEINMATAINRLSKIVPGVYYAHPDNQHIRNLVHQITFYACQLQNYQTFAIANIFDALANWQIPVHLEPYHSLVNKLLVIAESQIDFKGQTISNIFSALLYWDPLLNNDNAKKLAVHIVNLNSDVSDLNKEGLNIIRMAIEAWDKSITIPAMFRLNVESYANRVHSPTPRYGFWDGQEFQQTGSASVVPHIQFMRQ